MENIQIAALLTEVADLLDIQGEINPFRIRAYRNAVHTVEEHGTPLRKIVEAGGDLTELPAIGKDMANHITELVTTGRLTILDDIAEVVPRELIALTRIQGMGPKRVRKVWQELGVTDLDELAEVARDGQVAELEGFGKKTQDRILESIERLQQRQDRVRLADADEYVVPFVEYLAESPDLERIEVAGSYRRRKETVGDVDLLVIADEWRDIMERFSSYSQVARVDKSGGTRGTVHLASGLQVDLRIVSAESYGAAMVYFTGSKEHNIELRKRALDRSLSISEYGVFRVLDGDGADEGSEDAPAGEISTTGRELGERVAGLTEADVYASVDLPWIPPVLREARGEIAAAEVGRLPSLVEVSDLRGELHMHTDWSDGKDTIEAMVQACIERGFEYAAITDHSQALAMTGGLDAAKLRRQWDAIDEVQDRYPGFRILRGMEVDIMRDGALDLEDEMLEQLDVVIASVHSRFEMDPGDQTARILKAVQHPTVNLIGHATGRLINRRDPMKFALDEVLHAAAENGVAVEVNCHPARLDLRDVHLMEARRLGIPVSINTDAHRTGELDNARYGVDQAQRAWLEPGNVLNARPLPELLDILAK